MAQVVFQLKSGRDGTIELRDCEFIDHWKDVFKQNNNGVGVRPPSDVGQRYVPRYSYERERDRLANSQEHKFLEESSVEKIREGITGVQGLGFSWSHGMPRYGMGWDETNDIHRGFTTLTLTMVTDRIDLTLDERNELIMSQLNFGNEKEGGNILLRYHKDDVKWDWWNGLSQDEKGTFFDSVHKINSGIHMVENCRASLRESLIRGLVFPGCYSNIPLLDWNSKADDNITDAVRVDRYIGDVASRATDNNPYWNVYDRKNILGKDYLTAYVNYDDPGEWDVCSTFKTTKGGFEILPHMHKVVNSILVPWIHEWGYKATPEVVSPIQVGHIDERALKEMCTSSTRDSPDIANNQIVKVDLID